MQILQTKLPLGKTPLTIHQFGLGAAHIPKRGETIGIATVQEAWQQGIRFFDTAPLYSAGYSEELIGKALKGVPRDEFVLATKVGRLVQPDKSMVIDYSRDGILRSLDESLQRLQMDYADILHIHDPDDHYQQALDEAFPTLDELRSQGVIKAIGSGMNQWEMLADFARNADFDCFLLAGRYTLLEQTSLDFLRLCQEKKIGVILGGVYNSGILASDLGPEAKYNYRAAPEPILQKAKEIRDICQAHNVPLQVAALHFPLRNPGVTSMVLGAEEPSHIQQNLALFEIEVPDALWVDLRAAGLIEE
ncbi:MAG: aldo/keto reductase [Chloroflexota bacterium]